ncbi:MAG: HEPN domain-containing protein [Thermodesulfobacteriota bacterium]
MNPEGPRKVPGTPAEWMSHAKSDLRLARLAAGDEFVRREQICFHAQQAVEKAIKALLLSRGIEFPLTHDIEELLELVEEGLALPRDVAEVGHLTPYAVETRYPGYWDEITEDEAGKAVRLAELTVDWEDQILAKSETRP